MLKKLRYLIIGSPLPSQMMKEKKLNKIRALAAFSPDALASIAYANQEIYLGLFAAGAAGLSLSFPIAVAIALLLAIVALSYAQTIRAYPSGGGSYVVARENLGKIPGLVAAAALLLDYVLNAAVSLTAGVAALSSAFPNLWVYRVPLALGLLLLITLINLRGLRETGTFMAVPVYLFLFTFIAMLLYGIVRVLFGTLPPVDYQVTAPSAGSMLTIVLVLHAFSTGCTALTGIEAISNGVPAFRPPEWKNARQTLIIMAFLMGFLFVGSVGLTQYLGVIAGPNETILSALTRQVIGTNIGYYIIQFAILGILTVATNTSFAGFPRIAAILAADKYLPRQLFNIGDRLVFSNGILLLSGVTAILILIFNGETHLLVPLFAVGAFSAFTLSQAGMVRHWIKSKERGWILKAFLNGLGALVTGITLLIIAVSKFVSGAWISVLLIPLIIFLFFQINRHYHSVSKQLSLKGLPHVVQPFPKPRVVIPVSGVHRGMLDAVKFALSISDQVTGVYIDIDPLQDHQMIIKQWKSWFPSVELTIVPSPNRSIVNPLIEFLDKTDIEHHDGQQAVLILPEVITPGVFNEILHNQSADLIKKALLERRRTMGFQRIIIDVPFHIKTSDQN
ncbi:MAG TPA: APC family permease [Longilinea sp.]|nr:APC family permease [Longilinea sp.]